MITSAVRLSDLATSNMDRKEKAKLIKALGIFNLARLDLCPPPPLPAKHSRYALIGRVAAEWAQLEHLLDLIIWNLLTRLDRETASCLTAHIGGYGPKLRTIVALSKMLNLPADIEKKGVNPLVGKLAPVAEERARIVHDAWFGFPRSRHTRQFRSRSSKSAKFGLVPVKRAEMLQTIPRRRPPIRWPAKPSGAADRRANNATSSICRLGFVLSFQAQPEFIEVL